MARPNLSYLKNVTLALVGGATGVWCGISGMAVAPLVAPLLAWLVGLKALRLSGSVLLVTFIAAAASLLAYGQAHELHWRIILITAIAVTGGSVVGSLPVFERLGSGGMLRIVLVAFVLLIGAWMSLHGSLPGAPAAAARAEWLIAAGFIAGVLAARANVAGVLIVPALVYIARVPILEAQATCLATLVIVSAAPSVNTVSLRQFSPQAAIWSGFGAAFGALYGSRLAVDSAPAALTHLYGAGLVIVALVGLAASRAKPQTAAADGQVSR